MANTQVCAYKRIGNAVLNTTEVNGKPYYLAADVLEALGMRSKNGHKLCRYLRDSKEAKKLAVKHVDGERTSRGWLVTTKGLTNLVKQLNPRSDEGKARAQSILDALSKPATTKEPESKLKQPELFEQEFIPVISAFQFEYDKKSVRLISGPAGVRFVPLMDLCRNLGLDYSAQYKRIIQDQRFDWQYIPTLDAKSKKRETVSLALMSIHGWLYTIAVNRVKEELRPALLYYQKHLTAAIYDYCTKGYAKMNQIQTDHKDQRIETQASQISALQTQLRIMTEHAKAMENMTKFVQENTPNPVPNVPVPIKTTRSYAVQHVRGFATKMLNQYGCQDDPVSRDKYYDDLWRYLYTEFKYRVHADYITRFNNLEGDDKAGSILGMIEADGKMEEFYAMVKLLLPVNKYANQYQNT